MSKRQFTAVIKKDGNWYVGWIEEVPGVNTQGKTPKELKENLKDALQIVLETNKLLTKKEQIGKVSRTPITVSL